MSTEHTPGPWRIDRHLGMVVGPDGGPITGTANFVLTAAAPELLAACEAQHRAMDTLMAKLIALDDEFMPTESEAWAAVVQGHAAIAKATGSAS